MQHHRLAGDRQRMGGGDTGWAQAGSMTQTLNRDVVTHDSHTGYGVSRGSNSIPPSPHERECHVAQHDRTYPERLRVQRGGDCSSNSP